MRGVLSQAMVLCASKEPPVGSRPGDRVYFDGHEHETPEEQLPPKKKIFEHVQPHFITDEHRVATYKGLPFRTDKGVCTVKSIIHGSIR
jgi:glutamyl-tRNA synthetase